MNGYSEKMIIFVPSVVSDGRHRGERQRFDPSENLENSSGFCYPQSPCAWARRLKAVPPVVDIRTLHCGGCPYIPTGVSRFSFLHAQVFQNLLTKSVKKAHTPFTNISISFI